MERELASLLGVVFEITVKRGVLAYLSHSQLLQSNNNQATTQEIKQWENITVNKVYNNLIQQLRITDDNVLQWVKDYLRHLLVLGYGLGWTTIRKCLDKNVKSKSHIIQAIWCPLTLPGEQDPRDIEREKTMQKFQAIFDIPGPLTQGELDTGKAGRADFLLWLSPGKNFDYDQIICLEFSLNAPNKLEDFSSEISHCQEIYRHSRSIDSRSCFSRICAEVKDDYLTFSEKLKEYLYIFSSKDKPLYKLCQSASYTEQLVKLLDQKNKLTKKCKTLAVSVTNNGIETLSAEFTNNSEKNDNNPKVSLMKLMGEIYREKSKISENQSYEQELQLKIKYILNKLCRSLPKELGKQAKNFVENQPDFQENLYLTLKEQVKDFHQPMDGIEKSFFLEKIEETSELKEILGDSPRNYLQETWQKLYPDQKTIPLRDAHALVIKATLNKATREQMQVIALEGNPGIGKTTAVVESLKQAQTGFLFIYVSPRTLINRDVTKNLANDPKTGEKSGILTLTTNHTLIGSAPTWYKDQVLDGKLPPRHNIKSAVVIDGLTNYRDPQRDTLLLTPEQEQKIEDSRAHSKFAGKRPINHRDDEMYPHRNPGVIQTLAKTTHDLLESNPNINQVVITLATQGYCKGGKTSTINGFDKLFKHPKFETRLGKQERLDFAKRIPTIVAMIDEVAGDGAGTLFTHQLAKWLETQFISPWKSKGDESPFRVILIIADASLSNEIVLENFLESGGKDNYVPDKVLISPSQDQCCIRVTGKKLRLSKKYSTLHLMTNSYPASELHIDYSLRLTAVHRGENKDGQAQTNRQAIRQQEGEAILNNAYSEIARGLKQSAEQIIFFAQDKAFLRELQGKFKSHHPDLSVEIIDQSVPAKKRYQLINSSRRDTIKVVLMTSSGSRGISFPKADWIIASFPRFSVEASLMEIAQLIYRGRGFYQDPITQEIRSGDNAKRRLVLLINDFFIKNKDDQEDRTELRLKWLRQSSDLITLLMMLRSTIYTRITGDAGLTKKKLAFVPVGYITEKEMFSLISQEIYRFFTECNVFIKDINQNSIHKGIIGEASTLVKDLFKGLTLEGNLKNNYLEGNKSRNNIISYTNYEHLEKFVNQVANFSRPLLFVNESLSIPDHIFCIGPYWMEQWSDFLITEQFDQKVNSTIKDDLKSLRAMLYKISNNREIPANLRDSAKSIYISIKREDEEMKEFSILNKLTTSQLIISLPLDYPQFLKYSRLKDDQLDITRKNNLADPDLWHSALGRALTSHELVMPVLPSYKSYPWSAIMGSPILSQLDINFDSRYFMVSNELNLLNMILLEDY